MEADPTPSYAVLWNQIRNNLLVAGFSANNHALFGLDYDDGTEFMNSTENVLVYSGFKACETATQFDLYLGSFARYEAVTNPHVCSHTGWHSNNQLYADNLLIRPDMQSMDGGVKPE